MITHASRKRKQKEYYEIFLSELHLSSGGKSRIWNSKTAVTGSNCSLVFNGLLVHLKALSPRSNSLSSQTTHEGSKFSQNFKWSFVGSVLLATHGRLAREPGPPLRIFFLLPLLIIFFLSIPSAIQLITSTSSLGPFGLRGLKPPFYRTCLVKGLKRKY